MDSPKQSGQRNHIRLSPLLLAVLMLFAIALPALMAATSFPSDAYAAKSIAVDTKVHSAALTGSEEFTSLSIGDPGVDPTRIVAWPKADSSLEEIEESIIDATETLGASEETEIISNPDESDQDTLVIVESDPEITEDIISELMDSDLYDFVDFDVLIDPLVTYTATPNDPYYSSNARALSSWGLNAFPGGNFSKVWPRLNAAKGDANTAPIAVIDTGFDMKIEDRGPNIVEGYDFASDRKSVIPQSNAVVARHGTGTAGVIGAATNNGKGIAGAAWDNKVIIYKVADAENNIYLSAVTNAIRDVVRQENARIINLSLGGVVFPAYLQQAIDAAIAQDILVIASAGNSAAVGNYAYYPANYAPVLSVASIGPAGQWSSFSTYNRNVDIAAPGEQIATLGRSNQYNYLTGTSFSAPHVAAAAALVWRASPNLSAAQVQSILIKTARPIGTRGNQKTGAGAVDAAAAFEAALGLPYKPRIDKVARRENGVRVTWTRDNLCSYPSTGYILQYRVSNKSAWKNVTINTTEKTYSYTVTGLKENTNYSFRVATVNANGKGPFSAVETGSPYSLSMLSSKSTIKVKRGKSVSLKVAPCFNTKKRVKVSWISSKPKVASISTTGKSAMTKGKGSWNAYTLTDRTAISSGKKVTIKGLKKGTSYLTFSSSYAKKKVKVVVY